MVGYINTVDYAAWHIPCYNTHNCPSKRFSGSRTDQVWKLPISYLCYEGRFVTEVAMFRV